MVEDGLVATPGCAAGIIVGNTTYLGAPSSNTAVRNNLTSQLSVDNRDSGVVADHNVVIVGRKPADLAGMSTASLSIFGKPGTYAQRQHHRCRRGKERICQLQPGDADLIMSCSRQARRPSAPGTASGAPTLDILGVKRVAPYTAGAYSHP